MSGGSFNYLGTVYDLGGLAERRGDLERMCDAIGEYVNAEPAGAAAARTASLAVLHKLRVLDAWLSGPEFGAVVDVWHAVEWHHSCDYGAEQVHKALASFVASSAVTATIAPLRHADHALAGMPGGAAAWPGLRDVIAGAVTAALAEERGK